MFRSSWAIVLWGIHSVLVSYCGTKCMCQQSAYERHAHLQHQVVILLAKLLVQCFVAPAYRRSSLAFGRKRGVVLVVGPSAVPSACWVAVSTVE